jgi:hypothetical protein
MGDSISGIQAFVTSALVPLLAYNTSDHLWEQVFRIGGGWSELVWTRKHVHIGFQGL